MNDKTRTPYRIGYAPDDFVNNQEFLESLLKNQNVSKSSSITTELIKEYKRQALIDYITEVFQNFLNKVIQEKGMDVQVGVGEHAKYFRVYPVLTHFITDNMQAIELSNVNKENCRMCLFDCGKDFSHFCIGLERRRPRDLLQHSEVCARYSKYKKIRIKNIAGGHNVLFLSQDNQLNIKKYQGLHSSLGILASNNHFFYLSRCSW